MSLSALTGPESSRDVYRSAQTAQFCDRFAVAKIGRCAGQLSDQSIVKCLENRPLRGAMKIGVQPTQQTGFLQLARGSTKLGKLSAGPATRKPACRSCRLPSSAFGQSPPPNSTCQPVALEACVLSKIGRCAGQERYLYLPRKLGMLSRPALWP